MNRGVWKKDYTLNMLIDFYMKEQIQKSNYVRVSEALGLYADFSKVKPDVLYFATERGTRVHSLCASYAQDVWIPEVPEYCKGYFDSFTGWFDKHVVRVFYVEERFYNHKFFYTGQPDIIVEMRTEGIVLIDNKTPQGKEFEHLWRGAIAAYQNLEIPDIEIVKGGSLQFNPHGKSARMKWYDESAADFAQFLHALSAYRFFKKRR